MADHESVGTVALSQHERARDPGGSHEGTEINALPSESGRAISSSRRVVNWRKGKPLARRRYQKGTMLLRDSKAEPRWYGRFWEDVQDEDGSVRRVHRQEFLGRKGEGEGEIATEKLALRVLEIRLRSINDQQWKPNQYGLIFATRNGTAWTCRKPLRKLQAVLKELELPTAGLHAFRHAQVTIAERAGVPRKTSQARVGHDSAEVTALYAHAV